MSTQMLRRIIYREHGSVHKVCSFEEMTMAKSKVDDLKSKVVVAMIKAPINPADLNQIEGVYPVKPSSLPAVPGNEGVGQVVEVGLGVSTLKPGDLVIPARSGLGTWQSHILCQESDLLKVPIGISPEHAACITVNYSTAYRMLKDFVGNGKLYPGDVVIQNAGNSSVGFHVGQMCRILGLQCVSIVRDLEDCSKKETFQETCDFLYRHGATLCLSDREISNYREAKEKIKEKLGSLPKLALNGVGGESATNIFRIMGQGGTMVTYGGMSRRPVIVPTASLIFDDKISRGFWMTRWYANNTWLKHSMLTELYGWIANGQICPYPSKEYNLEDWEKAIKGENRARSSKSLLTLNK